MINLIQLPAAILNIHQQLKSVNLCTLDALVDPEAVALISDSVFSEAEVAGRFYALFIEGYDADKFFEKADSRVIGMNNLVKTLFSLLRQVFEVLSGSEGKLVGQCF